MPTLADLTQPERRTLATLARLSEGQTLIPQCDEVARALDGLTRKGLARGDAEEADGYRLTTRGAALAEPL